MTEFKFLGELTLYTS